MNLNTNTVAVIWADQIIKGKKTYSQVPRLLKEAVADILKSSGHNDLITVN